MISIERVRQYVKDNPNVSDGIEEIDGVAVQFICTTTTANRLPDQVVFFNAQMKADRKVRSSIENAFVLGDVQFNNIMFQEDFTLTIENTHKASISFTSCHFMGKLKIRNKEGCKTRAPLDALKFIDCSMDVRAGKINSYLRCGFLDVNEFVLQNLRIPAGAEVNIGDCHFKNFRLSNFRNLGKFKLYKINVQEDEKKCNGTFQIDNTSIGDADFQSIDLTSFNTRKIFDNILSGIDYTNVRWENPEKDIEVGQCEEGSRTEIAKQRDTYRVLKNVAQRNNDMQQALAFYAKEMKFHGELIKKNTSFCEIKQSFKSKELFKVLGKLLDRAILLFGRWTNNYGQNWGLPIFWILGLSVVFYIGLLWNLPGEIWVSERWAKFPLFLNPIHKIEFICEGYWDFWAYTIDTLFRILEGMLIYQTIQAFRKYSRMF